MERNETTQPVIQKNVKNGGFFSTCIDTLNKIAYQSGCVEEVIAYLVLQCFTKGQGTNARIITSAGAKAVSNHGGFSYRRAQKALEWLNNHYLFDAITFIYKPTQLDSNTVIPEYFSKVQMIKTKIQWILPQANGKIIYLPNTLFDGISKGSSPIKSIYDEVSADVLSGMSKAQARLDALMVLLNLYSFHDIEGCGGIDPRGAIYKIWHLAETGLCGFEAKRIIAGTPVALYEVKQEKPKACLSFINNTLSFIKDENDRIKCFWTAFHNIKRLGLMYEAITVWNRDPTKNKEYDSELLFTLYIFDRNARDREPFLQHEVHNTLKRIRAVEGSAIFDFETNTTDMDEFSPVLKSGKFRYLAPHDSTPCAIGIYRLRFRPHDRDTAIGFLAEERRHNDWKNALNDIEPVFQCN